MSDLRRPASELFARRRPRVVAFAWLVEALLAWVLAGPWSELVGAVYGQHPDGDRALFGDALVDAADFLVRQRVALQALITSTAWALAIWLLASIALLGGLLSALSSRPRPFVEHVARGVGLFPRLALLQLASLAWTAVCVGALFVLPVGLFASGEVAPPREVATVAIAATLTGAVLLVSGAFFDLARAIVARWDAGAGRAMLSAARTPRAWLRLSALSAPRVIASIGLVGFASTATTALRSVFLIALVHQAMGLGRVALRASVLVRALRLADDAYRDAHELDVALAASRSDDPEPEGVP